MQSSRPPRAACFATDRPRAAPTTGYSTDLNSWPQTANGNARSADSVRLAAHARSISLCPIRPAQQDAGYGRAGQRAAACGLQQTPSLRRWSHNRVRKNQPTGRPTPRGRPPPSGPSGGLLRGAQRGRTLASGKAGERDAERPAILAQIPPLAGTGCCQLTTGAFQRMDVVS